MTPAESWCKKGPPDQQLLSSYMMQKPIPADPGPSPAPPDAALVRKHANPVCLQFSLHSTLLDFAPKTYCGWVCSSGSMPSGWRKSRLAWPVVQASRDTAHVLRAWLCLPRCS